MLLKDNKKIYYKTETFNVALFAIKSFIGLIALALVLSYIFFNPFVKVNQNAISLANDSQFVKQRVDFIDSKKDKINKGDNFLTYDSQFFWNKNSSMVEYTNGYQKKFSNILMQQNRNTGNVLVSIKNVPDVSCAAFANYIKQKHGNVTIENTSGKKDTCPSVISSIFGNNKYTLTYMIK